MKNLIKAGIICSIIFLPAGMAVSAEKLLTIRRNIISTAKKYTGTAYNYGGTSNRGFDCSGFVHFVYKQNGIILARTSSSQYLKGKKVPFIKILPGDLVFFKIRGNKISHVGIYLGDRKFIHSPRTGRKVAITDMNIKYWKKRFAGSVTYLSR